MTEPPALNSKDAQLGRDAAEQLTHGWPEVSGVAELSSREFTSAMVERLAELIAEQPALFQASRRGSELGAESLSARPFQGIVESIQNADDLGARELRIALRAKGSHKELLIVHDGAPISLQHVGAMVLPWVSTKTNDPNASGRFGIGQNTLRALGGPIDAHCDPYHFRMGELPAPCSPEPEIDGFYAPVDRETLLVVPLDSGIVTTTLDQFMDELGTGSLVFLRSVRRVALIELNTGTPVVDHRLHKRRRRTAQFQIQGNELNVEIVDLTDRARGQTYSRYLVEMPLKAQTRRHNKATGATTTLGVCVPRRPEQGLLYDRLPLPVPSKLPVGLNAQFDPDTARSTLHESMWNKDRFADLGDLVAAVALDLFTRDAPRAWNAVPMQCDVPDGISEWLRERFLCDVVGRCQHRLADELRLGPQDQPRPLDEIVFEDAGLAGVLTGDDQERLAKGLSAVPAAQRGRTDRWRSVLREFGRSQLIDIERALNLLEFDDVELGTRQPAWYVGFAMAAIEADAFAEFCDRQGVLLADRTRIMPPRPDEPRSLVIRDDPKCLASQLGLTLAIHPVYLGRDLTARRVRGDLKDAQLLVDAYDSDGEALSLLARGRREPIRLRDGELLSLRDAFERLGEKERRELGSKIGCAIELRGFRHDARGKVESIWVSPSKAYLPTQIDREKASFARAAGKTHGLSWVSPDYRRVLKRDGGKRKLGARGLLARLGVQAFPRLTTPSNEFQRYARDPRRVSPIEHRQLPEVQATELRALNKRATHLFQDRWSPDLRAVIDNIKTDRPGADRKRRAVALLGLLARGWERQFADFATAQAVWGYDGYWHTRGDVISTWLAHAASEPWLPCATGALRAPLDLHLPSEANRLTIGKKRSLYLMHVDDHVRRSPALTALRIRRAPSTMGIVTRLEELRDTGETGPSTEAETRTAYRVLALACPPDARDQRPVDDMTVPALRAHFVGGRSRGSCGLLFIDSRWYSPTKALRGPPIFGRRRPFVANAPYLDPLWKTLQIPLPVSRDCVAVLRELAGEGPLADADRPVVIETMRALSRMVGTVPPQLRAPLRSLPVWTGTEWTARRPVYAIADEGVASAVADQARVWQPGFAIDDMDSLISALGLSLVSAEQFIPVAHAGYGAAAGDELRRRFVLAVEHLRDELARRDQTLSEALTVAWDGLAAAAVVVDRDLEVAARLATVAVWSLRPRRTYSGDR